MAHPLLFGVLTPHTLLSSTSPLLVLFFPPIKIVAFLPKAQLKIHVPDAVFPNLEMMAVIVPVP